MNRRRWRLAIVAAAALMGCPRAAAAHIGSPDVFLDTQAGPYRLFVTVRPPRVIPGVAEVEVFTSATDIRALRILPMPLTGPGAQFAPVPDRATPSAEDPRLFRGQLWMMTAGAWQVRVLVDGGRGPGVTSVPVPTFPQTTLEMSLALRMLLSALMVLLCAGFVSITAAFGREATLVPGQLPGHAARRHGRLAGAAAATIIAAVIVVGDRWWSVEAANYAKYVYKPLGASVNATPDGLLALSLHDPGWIALRRLDDFVADHGHLMHLFIVSPGLDRFWHLHPDETGEGSFQLRLPSIPQGEYELFADVVHATGISETIAGRFVPHEIRGAPLTGDDSAWSEPPSGTSGETAPLPDGGRMVRLHDDQPIKAGQLNIFTFRVDDAAGRPALDLEPYMGMPGHAIFISRSRQVFAHVHPSGSAPMAAIQIGEQSLGLTPQPGQAHSHSSGALPASVSFPFGLPERGDYRIFVQIKRSGRIETGAFDVRAE